MATEEMVMLLVGRAVLLSCEDFDREYWEYRMRMRAELENVPIEEHPGGWWAYFIDYADGPTS